MHSFSYFLSLDNGSGMAREWFGNGSGMAREWFGNDSEGYTFSPRRTKIRVKDFLDHARPMPVSLQKMIAAPHTIIPNPINTSISIINSPKKVVLKKHFETIASR